MEALIEDVRLGVRRLAKSPVFTTVVVLTLALGIGATTTVFSAVNAVLLRPLPYRDPGQLAILWEYTTRIPDLERMFLSYPDYKDWRARNTAFEDMGVYRIDGANLTGEGAPERVPIGVVSASVFPTLGVAPVLGRQFTAEEDRAGASNTVIIGDGLWKRRFGSAPDVVGRTLALDGDSYEIVGVMPEGFQFPVQTPAVDAWISIGQLTTTPSYERRGSHPGLLAVARVKPGVTFEQAHADMESVTQGLAVEYPDTNGGTTVRMHSLDEEVVGDVRPALLVIFGAMAFLLLIACATIANLMLTRAATRQRDVAIRTVLGAGRLRIARGFLVESVLLSLAGGALGLLFALWGVDFLLAISPEDIPRLREAGIDGRSLGFALAAAVATGFLFGIAPALLAARTALSEALKEGGKGTAGISSRNLARRFFVVSEIALALVLLVGASLLIKSFTRLMEVNPGFDPAPVLAGRIPLPDSKYHEDAQVTAFFDRVLEQAAVLPGAHSAAIVSSPPLVGGAWQSECIAEGRVRPSGEAINLVDREVVSPGYFETLGIPISSGRDFTREDHGEGLGVAIVDQTTAGALWPGEDPVGKRLAFDRDEQKNFIWLKVVGVVGHVKHYGLDTEARMQVYVPFAQMPFSSMTLVVRSAGNPSDLAPAVRTMIASIDRDQPLSYLDTMEKFLGDSVGPRRLSMLLVATFAVFAALLAAVGIYGVVAYSVSQRTQEIGIRMALGAQAGDVLRLILGQGVLLTGIGLAVGLGGALVVTRFLESLLFRVSATDPWVFTGLGAGLAVVAFLASYLPARRATHVDPMVALRSE
jgi:putative ABC transport system permease protein